MSILDDKVVLVTGGTGSLGRAFIRRALETTQVRKVIVFSRDELKQSEMRREPFLMEHEDQVRFFIGDVRDERRLRRAFQGVDYVIAAAALKQVPACEYNPIEAKKTNIDGAQNIIEAALDTYVERVIALSTDKATNPVNAYGASKLFAEKLFLASNSYSGEYGSRFACVRYGNVAGSRGSVIPLFRELAMAGADLPITHEAMTRFWFTLNGAVDLVLHALTHMRGGETFVPKLPSFRITDLAKAIAPDLPTEVIGLRPGEKLHESMIGPDESHEFRHIGHYLVRGAGPWEGIPMGSGIDYNSGNGADQLTVEELRSCLKDIP